MSLSKRVNDLLVELIVHTKKKEYEEIRTMLENADKEIKGAVFELYIEELYKGKGWLTSRKGGKGDLGADILLFHPKSPREVSLIIQTKNHNKPLSFDETRIELIKFEEEGQKAYGCNNYILISINGFVKDAFELEEFNMKMEGWEYVKTLIEGYNPGVTVEPEIELFAHNKITYKNIIDIWKKSKKVAAVQATGTGKSFLITKTLSDFYDSNKLVLAPSQYILNTIQENALWLNKGTTYMTYAKLMNLTEEELKELEIELLVLDEFHRVGAEKWGEGVERLLERYPDVYVLGTSATPIRYLDGSRDMTVELFDGRLASEIKLPEAILKGYLPEPYYVSSLYTLDEEIDKRKEKVSNSSMKEEDKDELLLKLKNIKQDWEKSSGVPQILNKHITSSTNKFIVFCKDKEHLSQMEWLVEKWFKESGFSSTIKKNRVISDDSYKDEELKEFIKSKRKNTTHLLFAIDMLNEGLHIKDVTGVILLRPTESPIIFYQQIGRAIASGNQNQPFIFDFVNNFDNIRADDFVYDMKQARKKYNKHRKKLNLPENIKDFTIYSDSQNAINLFKNIDTFISDTWELKYDELVSYKEKHGDCLVPQGFKENPKLATWVGVQRKNFAKGILSEERTNKLNLIDFIWNPFEEHWQFMYMQLVLYKNEFGNCLVPNGYGSNPQLATWVGIQRHKYKKKSLDEHKIQLLNSIDFTWNPYEEEWKSMYNKLKLYKEKYGDCLVPKSFTKNPKLVSWVLTQRKKYKNKTLEQNKIELLNSIGFSWDPNEEKWTDMYNQMKEYKKKYGNCLVPYDFKENPDLAGWVLGQRKSLTNGKMKEEKIKLLNDIGFVWNTYEYQWDTLFHELLTYKATHGDCLVPINYDNNPLLARWVSTQRREYKKGKLNDSKIDLLKSIGFRWEIIEDKWNQMYRQLLEYKIKYGNCFVPSVFPMNQQLSHWVSNQRKNYSKGILNQNKINLLEDINFSWNSVEDSWNKFFQELQTYMKKNNNSLFHAKIIGNLELGKWVSRQRKKYKKGKLESIKIDLLKSIGFSFDPNEDEWNLMYKELIKYKEKHGDCLVPLSFKENPLLAKWVSYQRRHHAKGKLDGRKINLLKSVGFSFNKFENQWESMCQKLINYKEIYGDCLVPDNFSADEQLGRWVSTQRKNYRLGKLSKDRIKKLNSLGFVFKLKN